MDQRGRLLTATEVAKRLGYTERYVWTLGREGAIPRVKVHGDHEPHGDRFWSLRRHVPVLTVIVDTPERLRPRS